MTFIATGPIAETKTNHHVVAKQSHIKGFRGSLHKETTVTKEKHP